jgi:hypothetical protein
VRFNDRLGGLFGRKPAREDAQAAHAAGPSQPLTPADLAKQRQSAANHQGVLNEEFARTLELADTGLRFPESPDDPLVFLGSLEPLGLSDEELKVVREWTRDLIEEKGERAVWNSRLRLKLELRYLAMESGLRRGIGRYPGEGPR